MSISNVYEAARLIDLYHSFRHVHNKDDEDLVLEDYPQFDPNAVTMDILPIPHELHELDISKTIDEIETIFKETGMIQLRDVAENVNTLVIGCGNRPLSDCSGYSIYESCCEECDGVARFYREEHAHEGCITIDPDLSKNPHIVEFFGDHSYHNIFKDHSFNKIIIEGICLLGKDRNGEPSAIAPYTISELKRLIAKDGQIVDEAEVPITLEELDRLAEREIE